MATPAPEAADALDLTRMDDDGGWQIVPGDREPGRLTRFRPAPSAEAVQDRSSLMDAGTTAERRREGGGSPRARRATHHRSLWTRLTSWGSAKTDV